MNIQHSSRTDLWYTPEHILNMVREVLGGIDLDPASDYTANLTVRASYIITKEQDGLTAPWTPTLNKSSVYVNPPGGKWKNKSLSALFWQRLVSEVEKGTVSHAIFMGFSAEILAISQGYGPKSILDFPICVPAKRIRFISPMDDKVAPSHSNVIAYVPGSIDNTDKFIEVFSTIGKTKR